MIDLPLTTKLGHKIQNPVLHIVYVGLGDVLDKLYKLPFLSCMQRRMKDGQNPGSSPPEADNRIMGSSLRLALAEQQKELSGDPFISVLCPFRFIIFPVPYKF